MSKRLGWLLGVLALAAIGGLMACGSKYSSSSDGLVLVGSQGSNVIQSFSFSLSSGHIAGISNPPATVQQPSAMVLDPAGSYAYAIVTDPTNTGFQCGNSTVIAGIQSFKVNSGGSLTAGDCTPDPDPNAHPVALAMDAAGKFLFVAEGLGGGVNSYTVSSGSLTLVSSTYTFVNGTGFQTPNFVALAPTATVFPSIGLNGQQNAVCSDVGNTPPPGQYLYVADSVNYVVWEFAVDTNTGALGNPPNTLQVPFFTAGAVPSGVAVDPCDRFVYVANSLGNTVSAYTICDGLSTQSQTCPVSQDGSLHAVTGSPFSIGSGSGPGPITVDRFGRFVYAVNTKSNNISPFQISSVSGSLTTLTVVATGLQPTAIAIRSDDNWVFVSNFGAATLSQYELTPATGLLTPQPAVSTDNYPWGVAVK